MGDEHNPSRYFGYDRPDAVGPTTYRRGTYDEAIYHRYGITQWETATGEAAFQYAPVERSAADIFGYFFGFADPGGGTQWYPMSESCNIDRMYAWVAHMSNEWTYALSIVWDRAADLFARTSRNLRREAAQLVWYWQSPAAEEFLRHVGAALTSLDDWRDAASTNASGLRAIASAIETAQEHLPPLYQRYLDRVELLALRLTLREDEAFRERLSELTESHPVMGRIRRQALTEARQEFHDEAVQYTKPIADAYTDVQFRLLGQGRRYEGPLLPDGGASRMNAAMSALFEALRGRIDGAMAGLPNLGAAPMVAPSMPGFVAPAPPSTGAPQFVGPPGPATPAPPPLAPPPASPPPLATPPAAGTPDGVLAGAPTVSVPPSVPAAPSIPAPPAMPGIPPVGLPAGPPGVVAPTGGAAGGPAVAPRGAAPAFPGSTAPPGVPPPPGAPGAARRPGTVPAGRPAGAALPGAIPPPAVRHPGSATGRTAPPAPAQPRLPGATAAPVAAERRTASPGVPPPTLPGQSPRPSGQTSRSAAALRPAGGVGRTGSDGRAALPGALAPGNGPGGAGTPVSGPRPAAGPSRSRVQERRPEEVLHVPGRTDDTLWTVTTPKGRLMVPAPKPDQPPPTSV